MKTIFTLILFTAYCLQLNATIHYVSHYGNDIPPFLSWQDAADSIQSAINVCAAGDTVLVANGTYYESLIISTPISLIGLSSDSTIINGTNLPDTTIFILTDSYIKNFTILGDGNVSSPNTTILYIPTGNLYISNCIMKNAYHGIYVGNSSGTIDQVIISDVENGVTSFCYQDTCHPEISNSVITVTNSDVAVEIFDGGYPTITNNIILANNSNYGIFVTFSASSMTIKNNIVSGFEIANIDASFADTVLIENNTTSYQGYTTLGGSIYAGTESKVANNIITHSGRGIGWYAGLPENNFNLFWKNNVNITGGITTDSTNVLGDPMFVNDTMPTGNMNFDYHLQAYSPAIDAGNPNIIDIDSTISDIGAYGGEGGQSYFYLNLPPRPPVNLIATVENGFIKLTWNHNSEADTSHYNVYRDTTANFTIDSTNLIASTTDTFYLDPAPKETLKLYYKITAVDLEGLESEPSEEAVIILTVGTEEWKVINNYALYQNYPNPFNPSTKIGYKLISRGYVKLLVYDITGSLVTVLVNEVQEAGYYEANFDAGFSMLDTGHKSNGLASGIYLYRIEVIGEGNIPRFTDLKKMILIK